MPFLREGIAPGDPPARPAVTAVRPRPGLTLTNVILHDPGGDVRHRGRRSAASVSLVNGPTHRCARPTRCESRIRARHRERPDHRDRRRRGVAALHIDLPARKPDPPRDERLRAVGLRQHRGAGGRARLDTSPSSWSAVCSRRPRASSSGSPTSPASAHQARSSRSSAPSSATPGDGASSPSTRRGIRNVLVLIVINAFFAFGISTIDWRAHVGGFVAGVVARPRGRWVQGSRALAGACSSGACPSCSPLRRSAS